MDCKDSILKFANFFYLLQFFHCEPLINHKKKFWFLKLSILVNEGIYDENENVCYKVVHFAKKWDEAREYCKKEFKNGDLAVVSNWKIKQTLEKGLTKNLLQMVFGLEATK